MNESIFETLLEPCFILNSEAKIIFCNETTTQITACTRRKAKNKKLNELIEFSPKIDWLENIASIVDPTAYKEVSFKNPDGLEGKVQITCQVLEDSKSWIVFFRDVTLEERLQKKYRAELEEKENYARNLEKMVAERTSQLQNLNHLMTALLDSLDQGFLIFNRNGQVLDVVSKACLQTLQVDPKGKKVWDVLKIPAEKVDGFQKWLKTLFEEPLPFEDLIALAPTQLAHSDDKKIDLKYYAIRDEKNKIDGVVTVSSDLTALWEAQQEAELQRIESQRILKLLKEKEIVLTFFEETKSLLEKLDYEDSTELFRQVHTLKGSFSGFGDRESVSTLHSMEDLIHQIQGKISPEIRAKLKEKSQLVLSRWNFLRNWTIEILGEKVFSQDKYFEIPQNELSRIIQILSNIISIDPQAQNLAQELTDHYFKKSVQKYLQSYQKIIDSSARSLGKEVDKIHFVSQDVRIDAQTLTEIGPLFVHVFRNAIDHGIEFPEDRKAMGKPAAAEIIISTGYRDQGILIEISDDGRGINPQIIREKLNKNSIANTNLTDQEVIQYIFEPSFSTKESVTELSGRGIGLDALKNTFSKYHGKVWVESKIGIGTVFSFWIPTTKPAYKQAA